MPRMTYEPRTFRGEHESLVQTAEQICAEYAAMGYQLTLRQLYYQFVSRDVIPNTERSYKNLGALISRARRAGRIDWNHIADRGRTLRGYSSWSSPGSIIESAAASFRFDLWGRTDQLYRPQVWVEKDALAEVVERACADYRVPFLACRGYPSDSVLWLAAQGMRRDRSNGCVPLVLHLGDHDPSGIDMTRDIEDRLALFGAGCRVQRIALTMDQVDEHNPPPNPAKTTDARFEGYREEYGDESWELDALPPDVLNDVIASNLSPYIDDEAWQQGVEAENEARQLLDDAAERWDEVASFLAG